MTYIAVGSLEVLLEAEEGSVVTTVAKAGLDFQDAPEPADKEAFVSSLRDRGVGPGDRVAVFALNSIEVLEVFLAGVRLGVGLTDAVGTNAGTSIVAVVDGVVGFFVVMRGAAFVADAVPQGAFAAPSASVAWHLRLVARQLPLGER